MLMTVPCRICSFDVPQGDGSHFASLIIVFYAHFPYNHFHAWTLSSMQTTVYAKLKELVVALNFFEIVVCSLCKPMMKVTISMRGQPYDTSVEPSWHFASREGL